MMKTKIFQENWTFDFIVANREVIKSIYKDFVTSFSYFSQHDKVVFMRQVKTQVYSLKFEEWKKDKIWKFINGLDEVEF